MKPQSCTGTKIQSLSKKFQAGYFVQNGKKKKETETERKRFEMTVSTEIFRDVVSYVYK